MTKTSPPPYLKARILAAARAMPSATRQSSRRATSLVLVVSLLIAAAIYFALDGLHADRGGVACLCLTLAAAAFPLSALLEIRRGSDPVHPATAGAALGATCGAAAGIMVELWCSVSAPWHVLVGHVAPIVVLALLGGALGRGVLAMKPVPVR
jgi:hypothetical protein